MNLQRGCGRAIEARRRSCCTNWVRGPPRSIGDPQIVILASSDNNNSRLGLSDSLLTKDDHTHPAEDKMKFKISNRTASSRTSAHRIVIATALAVGFASYAEGGSTYFSPGNLVVSRSVYDNNSNNVTVGQTLPPGCANTMVGCGTLPVTATNDGTYPTVWNNDLVDGSFGITSKIFLDQLTLNRK